MTFIVYVCFGVVSKLENDQEPQNVVLKVWKTQGFLVTVKATIVHINWSGRKGWNQGNFPRKMKILLISLTKFLKIIWNKYFIVYISEATQISVILNPIKIFSIMLALIDSKLFTLNNFLRFPHLFHNRAVLTLSWWRPLSYRSQSTDLQSKLMDWFLYDWDLLHERVNPRYIS